MTRLGEFSPIGGLFTLGRFFLIFGSSTHFYISYFFHGKRFALILTKKWFGFHFGQLFYKLIWSPWFSARASILPVHSDLVFLFLLKKVNKKLVERKQCLFLHLAENKGARNLIISVLFVSSWFPRNKKRFPHAFPTRTRERVETVENSTNKDCIVI
jgi:hypothetical protein